MWNEINVLFFKLVFLSLQLSIFFQHFFSSGLQLFSHPAPEYFASRILLSIEYILWTVYKP